MARSKTLNPSSSTRKGASRKKKATAKAQAKRHAILVLGMHRSGTSALTRVFSLLGAALPKNLMGPDVGNALGHWEPFDLVALHDEMLDSIGSSWDDWRSIDPTWNESGAAEIFKTKLVSGLIGDYGESPLFVVKDPRICRFLPVWRDVLERCVITPQVVILLRNPLEIAASLQDRNGFLASKSLLLWLQHVLCAERDSRDMRRVLVTYDVLIKDWRKVITDVQKRTDVRWPRRSDKAELEIEKFLSVKHRHHAIDPAELVTRHSIVDWVNRAYTILIEMSDGRDDVIRRRALDGIHQEFDKAASMFGLVLADEHERATNAQSEVMRLGSELTTFRRDADHLRSELDELQRQAAEREGALTLERDQSLGAFQSTQAALASAADDAARLRVAVEEAAALGRQGTEKAAQLEMQLSAAQAESAMAQRKLEDLVAEKASLVEAAATGHRHQQQAAQLNRDLDSARTLLRDSQTEVQRLAGEFDGAKHEAGVLSGHLDVAREMLTQSQDQCNKLTIRLDEALAESRVAQKKLETLADEKTALIEAVAIGQRHKQQAAQLAQDLEGTSADLHDSRMGVRRLAGELDNATRQTANITAALNAAREAVKQREREYGKLARHLESVLLERQTAQRTIESLVDEKAALTEAVALDQARKQQEAQLTHELQNARNLLQDSQLDVQRLSTELDSRAREVAGVSTTLSATRERLAQKEIECSELFSRLDVVQAETQSELLRLTCELQDSVIDKSRYSAELAKTEEELSRSRANLKFAQNATVAAMAKAENAVNAFNDLRRVREEDQARSWRARLGRAFSKKSIRTAFHAEYDLIRTSRLFDALWYLRRYADVAASGDDPLEHYICHGSAEGRDPHPLIDGKWYLTQADDLANSGLTSLSHYIKIGVVRGLDPSPLFDTDWYLAQNPDVTARGINPLYHFWKFGAPSGRDPNPLFDTSWYMEQNPGVAHAGENALAHYLTYGAKEGRSPCRDFDANWYLEQNPDVAATGVNALEHFIRYGRAEGRAIRPVDMPEVRRALPISDIPQLRAAPAISARPKLVRNDVRQWRIDLSDGLPSGCSYLGEVGVFLHLFYEDLAEEISQSLLNIPCKFRVYVSTDSEAKKNAIAERFNQCGLRGKFEVKIFPNVGRDMAPFVLGFVDEIRKHEICLRIHGKKSTHNSEEFGQHWRAYLLSELIGNRDRASYAIQQFIEHPDLGVLIGKHWSGVADWLTIGQNYSAMKALLGRIGIDLQEDQDIEFPSGAMFWFRGSALDSLFNLGLTLNDFVGSTGEHRDGTIAHAIERSILFFSAAAGLHWAMLPRLNHLSEMSLGECVEVIKDSGLFDQTYYLERNPDIVRDRVDPIEHFLEYGAAEGRDPSATFDTSYYLRAMSRSGAQSINPLVHYIVEGRSKNLPTRQPEVVPAKLLIDDLYSRYKPAEKQPDYVSESFPLIRPSSVKLLAFYLPQFHPFEENNRFWGRGFTEWTNTTKALPLFEGHYQPRLPGELGFYDTRVKDVIARQIELAKQYGVHGFCLHHYFFDGKPIMRAPYNHILSDSSLNIPFCLHWANEPWTARWDGLAAKGGVLLDQHHTPEDDLAFFRDIEPAVTDPRYIKIDGRPLLVIYRPRLFPDMAATIERWREAAFKAGVGDFYLAVMQTSFDGPVDPRTYGFDAAIEYPPHNLQMTDISNRLNLYDHGFEGNIFDYREAMEKSLAREQPDYTWLRGIIPGWDCTARRANPDIFVNEKPDIYQGWLESLCRYAESSLPETERFIFINAWNEWAEGAVLEPDSRHGYAYLNATAQAINSYKSTRLPDTQKSVVIGAHLYYTDLLDEFISHFRRCPVAFDLYVTTQVSDVGTVKKKLVAELASQTKTITVIGVDNVGRDMAPFVLNFLPFSAEHDLCCWVHSKKSLYEPAYAEWRKYLLDNLLGSPSEISTILDSFGADQSLGIVYPKTFPAVVGKVEWGSNFDLASTLMSRLGIHVSQEETPVFPAGGMFWFRPQTLRPLTDLRLKLEDFSSHSNGAKDHTESAVIDGTLSHALERMIVYVAEIAGYKTKSFLYTPAVSR